MWKHSNPQQSCNIEDNEHVFIEIPRLPYCCQSPAKPIQSDTGTRVRRVEGALRHKVKEAPRIVSHQNRLGHHKF